MKVLGIESSCDETACGIVDGDLRILANSVYSQIEQHARFGGVVPEIAARAHLEKIQPVLEEALKQAGVGLGDIDLVAFTRGPGLLGPLLVGASFARGLARSLGVPVEGVNHLEGHLASAYLSEPDLKPPFICLTVSGGHTELLRVDEGFRYRMLGCTRDDAAGEAFDKCGKLLGLGYPAGPIVSRLAAQGNGAFASFPRALGQRGNLEFSFSGLKTSVLRYVQEQDADSLKANLPHICASLESAIVDVLVRKTLFALEHEGLETVALVGGVSANPKLRKELDQSCASRGARAIVPPLSLCGDNGAMIAAMAVLREKAGLLTGLTEVLPSLSMG